jgi:hypothetical protein
MNKLPLLEMPKDNKYFFVITRRVGTSGSKYAKVITFQNIHSKDYDNLSETASATSRWYTGTIINVINLSRSVRVSTNEDYGILSYNPMPYVFRIGLNAYTRTDNWISTIKATYSINEDSFLLAFDENDTLCLYIKQDIAACYFNIETKDITTIDVDESPSNYIYDKEELDIVDYILMPEFETNNSKDFMFNSDFHTPYAGDKYHLCKCLINDTLYIKENNHVYVTKLFKTDKKVNFNGSTASRPDNLNTTDIGFQYFDTTLDKPVYWNGTSWVESSGNSADLVSSGPTANRPTDAPVGFRYFDTDINCEIVWDGSQWVNTDGTLVSKVMII